MDRSALSITPMLLSRSDSTRPKLARLANYYRCEQKALPVNAFFYVLDTDTDTDTDIPKIHIKLHNRFSSFEHHLSNKNLRRIYVGVRI
ncbi:hypothetical protein Zmor_007356 [Zophobas morio]|uniref:Uncharacterized protein n=1 Tax=Zophobas morio TaxID=2755281 RepID=A0AA38ITK8_9CUCU|nr:hypothetical protein Zmor_007356 [Zophobas morio]